MLIKVFSDFCSSDQAMTNYANIWNSSNWFYKNGDKEFEFTSNDDYTHAIILNRAMPILNVPKKNVLGIALEPLEFIRWDTEFVEYCTKNVGTYLIGKTSVPIKLKDGQGTFHLPPPFTCGFTFQWFNQERDNYLKIKKGDTTVSQQYPKSGLISIWFSQKVSTPLQQYRKDLVEAILKTDLPVDIYGKGCNSLNSTDPRIKGEYDNEEPYVNYTYCVTIENTESDFYITEKLMNCYANNTIPIYFGARRSEEIFGKNTVIRLTGNLENDLNLIKSICDKNFIPTIDMEGARYQLFEGNANFPNFLLKHWS